MGGFKSFYKGLLRVELSAQATESLCIVANAPNFRLFKLVLLTFIVKLDKCVELGDVSARTNETILFRLHVPQDEDVSAVFNAVLACATEVVLSIVLHVFIIIAVDTASILGNK